MRYQARHGRQWLSSDVINWCDKNLPNDSFWYFGDRMFEFDSLQDLTWFLLKWS